MRIKVWQVAALVLLAAGLVYLTCYEVAEQIVKAVEKVIGT